MKLTIQKDYFDNPHPPRMFLCTTGRKTIGELHTYDESLSASWNSYSELRFSIDRKYSDAITGETVIDPLFDKTEGLRKVYVENMGYFTIQDPETEYSDKDTKNISAFSSEYECASKYLENFRINTGEVDSAEVMYLEDIYGEEYIIDTPYEPVGDSEFDEYESYFVKEYTDNDSYTYERVEVANETVYNAYDGSTVAKTLYKKKYPNVRFYWPTKPELSLLHLIFQKIPEWNIGNVDVSLWRKERKFDEDRIAVYDFLMNDVADTFNCIVEWDTINMRVNFYEEEENGITEENTIQKNFDTDIYITRENLANEINIKYSTDDIKTKLKVTGSDDLNIREVNLGKDSIINLDFYHNYDWMEDDLYTAYAEYKDKVEEYSSKYTDAVSARAGVYNRYNELMNAVPEDGNVVLINDPFKKLYCSFTPTDTAFCRTTVDEETTILPENLYLDKNFTTLVDVSSLSNGTEFIIQGLVFAYQLQNEYFTYVRNIINNSAKPALIKKLSLYHINDDVNANNTDNILLKLKNKKSDTVTFRLYATPQAINSFTPYKKYYRKNNNSYIQVNIENQQTFNIYKANYGTLYSNSENYKILYEISYSESGIISSSSKTLDDWIEGKITAESTNLINYTVSYIGIMGAYFVLAKDETDPINLDDYGVKLLREKYETYTTIFRTQTEQMYSQEKYQCTVSDTPPEGIIPNGTRWLKTSVSPVELYVYNTNVTGSNKWVLTNVSTENKYNYENYQRYIDNYNKLKAVQQVLSRKEMEVEYYSYGYPISDMRIDENDFTAKTNYRHNGQTIDYYLEQAAHKHFADAEIISYSTNEYLIPICLFITSKYPGYEFAAYLRDKIPYVAFSSSVGVYEATMNKIAQLTNFENSFTSDQWARLSPLIREDEFSDSNFLLTGYESEEERISICKELMENASKKLKTLSQPSLDFSMNMTNILALIEFSSLVSQFQLGNFIRIELRPGLVKRARLLSVDLDFDDLSGFSCQFGNLVTTKDQIDLHAELMQQAIQAGKQVATSASNWQKAVDKSNKLEQAIANGLQDVTISVGRASGQSITWDEQGFHCRKLIEGTNQYEDEQIAIINNKLVFTNDGWKTSKAALGEFTVELDGKNQQMYGLLADAVVSGYINGSVIKGGSLEIGGNGGTFIVHEDGSVQILASDGKNAYASSAIQDAMEFSTRLEYENQTVFSDQSDTCTITCKVYHLNNDITTAILNQTGSSFSWSGYTGNPIIYSDYPNKITVNHTNISQYAEIVCQVQFDDSQWITNN